MIITLQSLGCKVPSALLLLKSCGYIKTKKSDSLSKTGLLNFFELFWEKWVVMDSNHRRHSQQIYSLPHLATLVTTPNALFLKASAKVVLFFHSTKFFCNFFLFFFKKVQFPLAFPALIHKKREFSTLHYSFFTLITCLLRCFLDNLLCL